MSSVGVACASDDEGFLLSAIPIEVLLHGSCPKLIFLVLESRSELLYLLISPFSHVIEPKSLRCLGPVFLSPDEASTIPGRILEEEEELLILDR